jgi:uncharacterized protein (UPF0276 family)
VAAADVNKRVCFRFRHGSGFMSAINEFPISYVGDIDLGSQSGSSSASGKDGYGLRVPVEGPAAMVAESAWALYRRTLERITPASSLIEWDNDVPPLPILAGEVERAKATVSPDARRRYRPLAS